MGFRRKSSDLYESVSNLKYRLAHFFKIWRVNNFCTNANFSTQMYYERLEIFQLYVIKQEAPRGWKISFSNV